MQRSYLHVTDAYFVTYTRYHQKETNPSIWLVRKPRKKLEKENVSLVLGNIMVY